MAQIVLSCKVKIGLDLNTFPLRIARRSPWGLTSWVTMTWNSHYSTTWNDVTEAIVWWWNRESERAQEMFCVWAWSLLVKSYQKVELDLKTTASFAFNTALLHSSQTSWSHRLRIKLLTRCRLRFQERFSSINDMTTNGQHRIVSSRENSHRHIGMYFFFTQIDPNFFQERFDFLKRPLQYL